MDPTPSNRHSDFVPRRPDQPVWVKVVLSLTLLIGPSMGTVHAAGILDELSPNQQQRITGICSFEHYELGFSAYRDCILGQLTVAKKSSPNIPLLATLTLDEQFAVQQTCLPDRLDSPTEKTHCIKQQIQVLQQEPAPNLASLSESERYVLANQCFEQQIDGSARDYRICKNNAIESLRGLPVADFSQKPVEKRRNTLLECSTTADTVSQYRQCLLASLGIELTDNSTADAIPVKALNTIESTSASNIEQPTSAVSGSGLVMASLDSSQSIPMQDTPSAALSRESADTIELDEYNETTSDTGVRGSALTVPEDSRPSPQTGAAAQASTETLNAPVDSKNNADNSLQLRLIAIASAISIPLLLLGIWLGRKSKSRQQFDQPPQDFQPIDSGPHPDSGHHTDPEERIDTASPGDVLMHNTRVNPRTPGRPDLRPLAPSANLPEDDHPNLSDTTAFEDALNETYAQPIELSSLNNPQSTRHSPGLTSAPPIHPSDSAPSQTLPSDRGRFASWLAHLPAENQLGHSIELLIYWMAYADNRYDPALKKEIFMMKDPDAHSLIKRWVFKKDASAFADAVQHLQQNTDLEQRRQIIHLLMALLVNEKALTPNQNVFLRFLSDAFGIGRVKLEISYLRAFGHTMPAMPRPDKSIWWQAYDTEQRLRWNFHSIAQLPEPIQSRIALGQPLQRALHPDALDNSYNLALKRCDHKQVDRLGERVSRLLSNQQKKFTAAYDALLEPVK